MHNVPVQQLREDDAIGELTLNELGPVEARLLALLLARAASVVALECVHSFCRTLDTILGPPHDMDYRDLPT